MQFRNLIPPSSEEQKRVWWCYKTQQSKSNFWGWKNNEYGPSFIGHSLTLGRERERERERERKGYQERSEGAILLICKVVGRNLVLLFYYYYYYYCQVLKCMKIYFDRLIRLILLNLKILLISEIIEVRTSTLHIYNVIFLLTGLSLQDSCIEF
jgi:hypothetical protein